MAEAPKPPSSVTDLDAIDVEFDDPLSVDKLLEITGENWSIDAQVESLKEATKSPEPKGIAPLAPQVRPPLPTDLDPKKSIPPKAVSMPPPLPSAPPPAPSGAQGAAPPLPAAAGSKPSAAAKPPAPPPKPSVAPPPLPLPPIAQADATGSHARPKPSVAPPPLPLSADGTGSHAKPSVAPPLPPSALPLPPSAEGTGSHAKPSVAPPPLPPPAGEKAKIRPAPPPPPPEPRERLSRDDEATTLPIEGRVEALAPQVMHEPPKPDARTSVVVPPPLPRADKNRSIPPDGKIAPVGDDARPKVPPPAPPVSAPAKREEPARARGLAEHAQVLLQLLEARSKALEGTQDTVGLARTLLELSIAEETLGDEARASAHAEAALRVDPKNTTAHGILRRRSFGKASLGTMLEHLAEEIAGATTEAASVELLAERARLLSARGDRPGEAIAAWEHVLTRAPVHAGALRGLESALWEQTVENESVEAFEALVSHLGDLADAYASQPELSAWLLVESGLVLERRLGRPRAARSAFERALALDPQIGAVRSALVRHVTATGDFATLAALLEEEAGLETDPVRASRLDLDAACICRDRLADDGRAMFLLERAASRVPTSEPVDRRVLDDLCDLYEEHGQLADAVRIRGARLRFVTEPSVIVHERRYMAEVRERLSDFGGAIDDLRAALEIDSDDARLVDMHDRLLHVVGRHDERVSLWLRRAAEALDAPKRARALVRAAAVLEKNLGRPDEARMHLKAAWVASPGDAETLDALSRLMSPTKVEPTTGEVRKLVELYAQAADGAKDPGRRIAFLEKGALLWEELLGEASRAAKLYEDILDLEPDRRGAVLGLLRTAARVGDDRGLSRALLSEAKRATPPSEALALRSRAAEALSRVDPARAIAIVDEVLSDDGTFSAARALETRLHEEAGRWERVAESLRARIASAGSVEEKVGLWLCLARVCDVRLGQTQDALLALESAKKIDPVHPVPPVEIARMLRKVGDFEGLRGSLERLGDESIAKDERARFFVRAAELDELRLGNDASAAKLYARALAETPEDPHVAERLERVLTRRALAMAPTRVHGDVSVHVEGLLPIADLLEARLRIASSREEELSLSFDLAQLLVDCGKDAGRSSRLLEGVLEAIPSHVPSLRLLEVSARRQGSFTGLARVLGQEGSAFTDVRARAGALWNLAWLEEWRLPVSASDGTATYAKLLDLDPTDPGALEATVRRELANARRGDPKARRAVHGALRAMCALVAEDGPLLALLLRLGLMVEAHALETGETDLFRSAMERFRAALETDPQSVTAATALSRLATRLGDAAGALAASLSLSDLASKPDVRARYLVDAAEILLAVDPDESERTRERIGPPEGRAERACAHLEAAIAADPNARAAAVRLAHVRRERGESERLVEVFFTALSRAKDPDAIVLLGTEIAKVARDDLKELTLAIDAMRKVREAAPGSIPSLLMLAELCIAQRAWPEAVEALEDVVARGKEPGPRLTALFALASVFEKVLSRVDDAEAALRRALEIDPVNLRALRALIHRLVAKQGERAPGADASQKLPIRLEIAALLERLAEVEPDFATKTEIFLQLAEVRASVKDGRATEKAIIDALAHTPAHPRAEERFERLYRAPDGKVDAVAYARGLAALVGRGQSLSRSDASWYFRLGRVEVRELARLKDGTAHLRQALKLAPDLHDARVELAQGLARLGAHDEAVAAVMALVVPSARPLVAATDASVALEVLERSLGADRRPEEAIVVSEIRAIMGDLDEGRNAWLRARRLGPMSQHHMALDRTTLFSHVVPEEGRHPIFEVAAAVAGLEAKTVRGDLAEVGLQSKDKLGKRSGHPLRALLDRLARALGLGDVELAISPQTTRVRVIVQDVPWVVVPHAFVELPEPTQLAGLGRALARIAMCVPWIEELPAPHVEAYLVACARQAMPAYGRDELDVLQQKLCLQYEPLVAKEIGRKQKQALERVVPALSLATGRPAAVDVLVGAIARAELRTAYVLTGDALATIDELRAVDGALHAATEKPGRRAVEAVLAHPFAGDVVRFALGSESVALRRRVGSTWAS